MLDYKTFKLLKLNLRLDKIENINRLRLSKFYFFKQKEILDNIKNIRNSNKNIKITRNLIKEYLEALKYYRESKFYEITDPLETINYDKAFIYYFYYDIKLPDTLKNLIKFEEPLLIPTKKKKIYFIEDINGYTDGKAWHYISCRIIYNKYNNTFIVRQNFNEMTEYKTFPAPRYFPTLYKIYKYVTKSNIAKKLKVTNIKLHTLQDNKLYFEVEWKGLKWYNCNIDLSKLKEEQISEEIQRCVEEAKAAINEKRLSDIKNLLIKKNERYLQNDLLKHVYVTYDDSIKAGNCIPLTKSFIYKLGFKVNVIEKARYRADKLLAIRNDSYVKKAIIHAVLRYLNNLRKQKKQQLQAACVGNK